MEPELFTECNKNNKYTYIIVDNKKILHGKYIEYAVNGIVNVEAYYDNGILNGPYKEYRDKDKLRFECYYVNGILNGPHKTYCGYECLGSHLVEECNYDSNGLIQGAYKKYYCSGALKAEYIYKNNDKNGPRKEYYESGELQYEGYYVDNKPNGRFVSYYDNKQIEHEYNYVDNKRNGIYKQYYKSGKLYKTVNYVDDVKDGNQHKFYPSGALQSTILFKNGKKEGKYTEYHDDIGSYDIKIIAYYDNGKLILPYTEYRRSGSKAVSINIIDGRTVVRSYDIYGAVEREYAYTDIRYIYNLKSASLMIKKVKCHGRHHSQYCQCDANINNNNKN